MQSSRRIFRQWASIRRADLALIALYSWFVSINVRAAAHGDLSVLILILQECCVIALVLNRRHAMMAAGWDSPQALLGYAGTLAPLFVRPAALAPLHWLWIGVTMQAIGNVLALLSILQLGRSFGIIAADRGIKTRGLYRSVRHPIYAAYLLAFGGFVLTHPSAFNSLVLLVWMIIQIARIDAEESVLMEDPTYCVYRRVVRYRLIPGLW